MAFNPHTAEDRSEMLAVIGIDDLSELFEPIPAAVRRPRLDLPPRLTEMEAAAYLDKLASKNLVPNGADSFLGAGSYRHYSPATVSQLLLRGELFTAYTPYQPEVAQGTLQIIYEFQSLSPRSSRWMSPTRRCTTARRRWPKPFIWRSPPPRRKRRSFSAERFIRTIATSSKATPPASTFEMESLPLPIDGLATHGG